MRTGIRFLEAPCVMILVRMATRQHNWLPPLNNSKKMLVLLERLYGASIVNLNDTTREKSTEISSQSPVSYFGSWRGFCLAAALRKAE
jgi:hypothetical protein